MFSIKASVINYKEFGIIIINLVMSYIRSNHTYFLFLDPLNHLLILFILKLYIFSIFLKLNQHKILLCSKLYYYIIMSIKKKLILNNFIFINKKLVVFFLLIHNILLNDFFFRMMKFGLKKYLIFLIAPLLMNQGLLIFKII